MRRIRKKDTPGQKLWLSLYRAEHYDQQAERSAVAPGATKLNPQRATRRWLEGMSRNLKSRFSKGLRERREELGLTQQQLAELAELTATAVAMIERGERSPNLDTATRLCWALDAAAGVTAADLN
jgi:DNA-binding XRE family transcriptional regulator